MSKIILPIRTPTSKPFDEIISSSDRKAWLAMRGSGIGASESAAVLGLDPFQSAFTLFQRKLGLIETPDNEAMKWGRRLETACADAFAEEAGRKVWGGGIMLRSKHFPWLFATPDREQRAPEWNEDGLLEIKTTGAHMASEWSDEFPVYYQVQLQHQLIVTGLTRGTLACLIGGQRFVWADFERNDEFCKLLIRKTEDFWGRVQSGEQPDPDDSESTFDTLKHMSEQGIRIDLPEEAIEWHRERARAAAEEKDARERKEKYTRLIAAEMGDAALGVLPMGIGGYTFKTRNVREYTVPAKSRRELRFTMRVRAGDEVVPAPTRADSALDDLSVFELEE